jgi:hypothetical protein
MKATEYKIIRGPIEMALRKFVFLSAENACYVAYGNPTREQEFAGKEILSVPNNVPSVVEYLQGLGFEMAALFPAVKGYNRIGKAPLAVLREVWPAKPKRKAAA